MSDESRSPEHSSDEEPSPISLGMGRWLADAGFVESPAPAPESAPVAPDGHDDDPWADVDLGDVGLTDAQRTALADPQRSDGA